MATDIALVRDGAVVNVAVFDETVWDFETWDRFQAEHEALVPVVDGEPWIGWTRQANGTFAPPPEPPAESPADG